MASDAQLFESWANGNDQAGNELFERYFEALFRFFRNKVQGDAEDLVQQTFLACVRNRSAFRGDASFRSFVYAVARSKLYDHFRANRQREKLNPLEQSLADLGTSPSQWLAQREDQQLLLQGLARIPLELQLAVELFYFEDLSAAEVARVLEVPEGTVRSRVRRALALLKQQVEGLAAGASADLVQTAISMLEQAEQRLG